MSTKNFIRILALITLLAVIIAARMAVRKVRAQLSVIQPFMALEVNEAIAGPGHGAFGGVVPQIPPPFVYTRIFAVRSDGSIAIVQKFPNSAKVEGDHWVRMVYDATAKTKTFYDPVTSSKVIHAWVPDQTLRGDEICSGPFDGKIEGFDVIYHEKPLEVLADGEQVTHKVWFAPKLGCFALKDERISMHEGSLMNDSTRLMTNIRIGEPDEWYFADDSTLTPRTPSQWDELYRAAK